MSPCGTNSRERRLASGHSVEGPGVVCDPWISLVSSRLGQPVERRRRWFQMLEKVVWRARIENQGLLVAPGTTAEPWVVRAAELYAAPVVHLRGCAPGKADEALITLADHVVALRVRRGGLVERLIRKRLRSEMADVQVAVWGDPDDAAEGLIRSGAIGWYLLSRSEEDTDHAPPVSGIASFAQTQPIRMLDGDQWLVHCTRGRNGRFPWQSAIQWRDEVLLGGEDGRDLNPARMMEKIVRTALLRGSPLSRSEVPVVCFSAVPLDELLRRRIFRSHRGRWDYEPYGIAVRRRAIQALGGCPVVYGERFSDTGLATDERWRYQPRGRTFDWTLEREWRVRGSLDLNRLDDNELALFIGDAPSAMRIAEISRWPVIDVSEIA